MTDAELLDLIKKNRSLQHFANCGYDAGLASAAVGLVDPVPSHVMLTTARLIETIGLIDGEKFAKWLQQDWASIHAAMGQSGFDTSDEAFIQILGLAVDAQALTEKRADELAALSVMPHPISHEQVSAVLNPLRAAKDPDGVARTVEIF
jgi:hypothetical protein